ncbi:hypothetical protein HYU21_02335 [Candidatus Woesearchaeota archaeon]|nr:hypothetical protein [Candidatus Woesearchaeota archaeon]
MNVVDEINLENKNQDSNSSPVSAYGSKSGLKIERHFTKEGVSPFDQFTYEKHVSLIKNPDGTLVFHNDDVEVPNFWSQVSTDILAQKYFRKAGVPLKDAQSNLLYDENGKWRLKDDLLKDTTLTVDPDAEYYVLPHKGGTTSPGFGLVVSVGKTFRSGNLNIPVNIYMIPQQHRKEGWQWGISLGFNVSKK